MIENFVAFTNSVFSHVLTNNGLVWLLYFDMYVTCYLLACLILNIVKVFF